MRLVISSPMSLVVDIDDVRHIRAEDESGAFGLLPGYADFLTVLSPSVVSWRHADDTEKYAAVLGGVLFVRDKGALVEVATREAVLSDRLEDLEHAVASTFKEASDYGATVRTVASRLHIAIMRKLQTYLEDTRGAPLGGPGSRLSEETVGSASGDGS